jgi:hypothetical protein
MERYTFSTAATATGRTLSGVAHAFGQVTERNGRKVSFAKGAFDRALAKSDIRGFVNHNTDLLLGRQSNGTIEVSADSEGLKYAIDVPETTYGDDLLVVVKRGDMQDMSFGIDPGKATKGKDNVTTYADVDAIYDISPVSLPAFAGTSIALHSASSDESVGSQLARARHRVLTGDK